MKKLAPTHMEWRSLNRFPEYEVSEHGDIRRIRTGKRICGHMDRDGYVRYALMDVNGVKKTVAAHRLVMESFCGQRPSSLRVAAHCDGSRMNCHYSNLRWATVQENHDDREFHGNALKGERNHHAKITEEDVHDIRKEYRRIKSVGGQVGSLDKKYGLTRSSIIRIANGQSWSHVPMQDYSEIEA